MEAQKTKKFTIHSLSICLVMIAIYLSSCDNGVSPTYENLEYYYSFDKSPDFSQIPSFASQLANGGIGQHYELDPRLGVIGDSVFFNFYLETKFEENVNDLNDTSEVTVTFSEDFPGFAEIPLVIRSTGVVENEISKAGKEYNVSFLEVRVSFLLDPAQFLSFLQNTARYEFDVRVEFNGVSRYKELGFWDSSLIQNILEFKLLVVKDENAVRPSVLNFNVAPQDGGTIEVFEPLALNVLLEAGAVDITRMLVYCETEPRIIILDTTFSAPQKRVDLEKIIRIRPEENKLHSDLEIVLSVINEDGIATNSSINRTILPIADPKITILSPTPNQITGGKSVFASVELLNNRVDNHVQTVEWFLVYRNLSNEDINELLYDNKFSEFVPASSWSQDINEPSNLGPLEFEFEVRVITSLGYIVKKTIPLRIQ